METFAKLVERGRTATGLSHQRVADLVGRVPSTIRAWERGRSEPNDPEVVMALAAVLDIPEDLLLESLGLTRPTDSIGGSIEDLAPVEPSPEPEEPSRALPPVHVQMEEPVVEAVSPPPERSAGGSASEEPPQEEEPVLVPAVKVSHRRLQTHRTAIPPQPMQLIPPQRSYIEDRRQMTTYRIRTLMTIAVLVGLLLLVDWGLHGVGLSLKEALSGLHP